MGPINAELAVDVAYPVDANAIEATQQLLGNMFSALLVPLAAYASTLDVQSMPAIESPEIIGRVLALPSLGAELGAEDIRGDSLLLLSLVGATLAAYSTANFRLLRS